MKPSKGGMSVRKQSEAAFCRAARAYLNDHTDGQGVSIGGFCAAVGITLEALRGLSGPCEGEPTTARALVEQVWTLYFTAAEAALDGKDTAATAKFRLERMMTFFEDADREEERAEPISVTFDADVEPYCL